jgi:hypothetical protein
MKPETERSQPIKFLSLFLIIFDLLLKHDSFLGELGTLEQSFDLGPTKRLDQTMHVACTTMHFDPFRTGLHEGFIRRQGSLLEYIVKHLVEDNAYQLEHVEIMTIGLRSPG